MGERRPSPLDRPEVDRANTWPSPSATPRVTIVDTTNAYDTFPRPAAAKQDLIFENSLDSHPEEHFLSPVDMYEYEDWASDSEDDDDGVEWNAGITDFALFDQDRRRAEASGQAIPERWGHMLSSQASALGRAVERSNIGSADMERSSSAESMPGLTPDASPQLCDDLDIGSCPAQTAARPVVPEYLRTAASTPSIVLLPRLRLQDDEAGLSFYVPPLRTQSQPHMKFSGSHRPGLRDGRTLSGKEHAWRRPSFATVNEEPLAEGKAEDSSN